METVMLVAQLAHWRADFDRLLAVLDAPELPAAYRKLLSGRFKRALSPLLQEAAGIEVQLAAGSLAEAWNAFADLQRRGQHLFEEALEFLGGIAIREMPPVRDVAGHAERFLEELVSAAGVSWSPAVIVGQWVDDDLPEALAVGDSPDDSLVRLPLPRWDVWYLPLLAHDYGYWIAKRGRIPELDAFVADRLASVQALFEAEPAAGERALWIPELRALAANARQHADDLTLFREGNAAWHALLCQRQQLHLWHWIADALAAALAGPVYAWTLLLLALNPNGSLAEGDAVSIPRRSRYMPADVRRMIVVLHVLTAIDARLQADPYAEGGPFLPELRRIAEIWEQTLDAAGDLPTYRQLQDALQPWCALLDYALDLHFSLAIKEVAERWATAQQTLAPLLRQGAVLPAVPEMRALLSAAWSLRARHAAPDHIKTLTLICEQLLRSETPMLGLLAAPPTVPPPRVLPHNWVADLETDVERLTQFFRTPVGATPFEDGGLLDAADRDAVAGRFFRQLSEQDFALRKRQRSLKRPGVLDLALLRLDDALQLEALDFLGGVLIRRKKLDAGICTIADALLRDYARMTGVNWTSRTVPGRNPLFSPATDMVQLHFPDWDLWNLPLMAHEFGHVAALATPAFRDFVTGQAQSFVEIHPEAGGWTRQQKALYVSQRESHLHEFFADAFAVYCQGPAFAFDMVLLNLNPAEAYAPRGHHPTHAERFEGLLTVLGKMNASAQQEGEDTRSYERVINWLKAVWQQNLTACGAQPDELARHHCLQARRLTGRIYGLLEQFYRLGAQFTPADWKRVDDTADAWFSGNVALQETLRTMLNIAWACRARHPERAADIAHRIWSRWRQWDFASSW